MSLKIVPLPEISVYVHIPFCRSRCSYCDFYFEVGAGSSLVTQTLDRILEEAAWFARRLERPRIRTIYLGGGTPSLIPAPELARFLAGLSDSLGLAGSVREWTIEANPESVSDEFLTAAAAAGVDRLSLGIQSFQDGLLRRLGRRANADAIDAALATIGTVWSGRLTVDLMTGIPGQTRRDLDADLERLGALRPGHVSLYSLTVEPGTPLVRAIDRGKVTPLPQEEQDQFWIDARDRLISAGYRWYEVSNYALPGEESLHNPVYWRSEPYLGLGPGAVGTVPVGAAPLSGGGTSPHRTIPARLTNPPLAAYLAGPAQEWKREVEQLDDQTLLFEHFMLGLRTERGICVGRLKRVFGLDADMVVRLLRRCAVLWDRIDRAALAEGRVALDAEGRVRVNGLLVAFSEVLEEFELPQPARWPALRTSSPD